MKINIQIDTEKRTVSIYDTSGGSGEIDPTYTDYRHLLKILADCSYRSSSDIFDLPTDTFKALQEEEIL